MAKIPYCTPEWLEAFVKTYKANPKYEKDLKKLTTKLYFNVQAELGWGIDEDIIFGAVFEEGRLVKAEFLSAENAKKFATFVLSATAMEWKKILTKKSKFVTDFMLGKIKLDHGSKVGVLGIAPHSNTLVDSLTQVELQWPDEMTADEVKKYRANMKEFRSKLGV
jgi:putative sterol carrier protein